MNLIDEKDDDFHSFGFQTTQINLERKTSKSRVE